MNKDLIFRYLKIIIGMILLLGISYLYIGLLNSLDSYIKSLNIFMKIIVGVSAIVLMFPIIKLSSDTGVFIVSLFDGSFNTGYKNSEKRK